MRDQYGRDIHDLRVSLTERCNLRCVYCVPEDGVASRTSDAPLRDDELLLLVRVAADLGVRKIHLTGGEPTLRPGLVELVRAISLIPGIEDLAMTTNGLLLAEFARPLAAAGLRRVNVSLDTLDPEQFRRITRGGRLDRVLGGIAAAETAGLRPVKINTVVIRGFNDDVVPLAALTLDRPWEIRFIEAMPFDRVAGFAEAGAVRTDETMARIEGTLGTLTPVDEAGPDPAATYRLPGAVGTLGFISPVSQPFCAGCGRLRLTADGRLRLCLLHDMEEDLVTPLRRGATYTQLKERFRAAAFRRPMGHLLAEGVYPRTRTMMQIGG